MTDLRQLRAWWAERSPRERLMLQGLGLVLGLLLLWYGVISPLRAGVDWAREQRLEAASDLALVEAAARASTGRVALSSDERLGTIIDATAAATGIAIERRREDADGRLTVWVASVEPRILMQWILTLRSGQGVAVTGMTAEKADDAGLAVEVSFERPAT